MSKRITLEKWKNRIKYLNPQMELLNTILPKGTKEDPFICHCGKCDGVFETNKGALCTEWSMVKRNKQKHYWCPVCYNRIIIKGINDVSTIRPDLCKYFVDINDAYIHPVRSNAKVLLKCPDCGVTKKMTIDSLSSRGFSCSVCSDGISYPNKICRLLLKTLPVDEYDFEYIDDWTEGKKYDGYFKFKNNKYLLEFDGSQHSTDTSWASKDEQENNDKIKNKLAELNNYNLIRIDCNDTSFEKIREQIFLSDMSKLFDLKQIDWERLYRLSLKSILLEVVKYYNDKNGDISTLEIAKQFNLGRSTISRYLHRASEAGLIIYDSVQRENRRIQKVKQANSNKQKNRFYVYDLNNELIGEFTSINNCVNYLNNNNILDISVSFVEKCLTKHKKYKGYIFEYVDGFEEHYKDNEIIRNVCNYFILNQNQTNEEIAKHFGISKRKVGKYIFIGKELNLYSMEDLELCTANNIRFAYKPKRLISVFKNGNYIDIYNDVLSCYTDLQIKYDNVLSSYSMLKRTIQKELEKSNIFDYNGFRFEIQNIKEAA